jgi:hypothetical protein
VALIAAPCFSTGMSRTVPHSAHLLLVILVGKIYWKRPTRFYSYLAPIPHPPSPLPPSTEPSLPLVVFLFAVKQLQPAYASVSSRERGGVDLNKTTGKKACDIPEFYFALKSSLLPSPSIPAVQYVPADFECPTVLVLLF